MNKVLLTGLGIGKELDVCQSCNMNYESLLINPEVLLWADKICIPKDIHIISNSNTKEKGERAINLMLAMLEDENLIEYIDIQSMYTPAIKEIIFSQAEDDIKGLLAFYPEDATVKDVNDNGQNELFLNGSMYCEPMIASIIASMIVADDLGANCLFSARDEKYLRYRSEMIKRNNTDTIKKEVYKKVFSVILPNDSILPKYIAGNNCGDCMHDQECHDSYLIDLERSLKQVLKSRDYDELYQVRSYIEKIIQRKNKRFEEINVDDLIQEFEKKKQKIQRTIKRRFPKVQRFINLSTLVTVPLSFGAAYMTKDSAMNLATIRACGSVAIVESVLKAYRSKNSWVYFLEQGNMKQSNYK